ncbi:MAG TPA: hypothetical protein VK811_01980 [Candidatus Acidoferrum sp.]|nr:hypothetical protein [Candidatus Acidoferrum sp.]
MGAKINVFRFSILILVALPLSCATRLPPPQNLSSLNDKNSIVFGKMEVLDNGDPIHFKTSRTFLDGLMMCHVSQYVSNQKLNRDLLVAGQYAFKVALDNDGYFSFLIPPGKYYLVELDYVYVFPDEPSVGIRTYQGKSPFLMTFDALPNRAVCIGTIQNDYDAQWGNWLLKRSLSISVTNDFADTKNWFLKSNPKFETNVVEEDLKISSL